MQITVVKKVTWKADIMPYDRVLDALLLVKFKLQARVSLRLFFDCRASPPASPSWLKPSKRRRPIFYGTFVTNNGNGTGQLPSSQRANSPSLVLEMPRKA